MKKQVYIISMIVLFTGMVFSIESCKKDDSVNDSGISSGSGKVAYLGKEYALNFGNFEDYGEYDGIYYYQVYLFSEGVDIANESGSGNVVAIYFSTYSPPLSLGTIPYYTEFVDPIPTCEAEIVLEYDLDNEIGIRISSFTEGTSTISKSSDGNSYTIQFNFTTFDGDILSGEYTGNISEI